MRISKKALIASAFLVGVIAAGAAIAAFNPAQEDGAFELVSLGEARGEGVTVEIGPTITDTIHGKPEAAGRPIVVLDAGHGGHDPGASAVSGKITEKDLTLAFARDLRDVLVERGRVRVALTRSDDSYRTLEERAALARRVGASVFLSLHMDSAPNPLARGATFYSLSDVASDADAERFARKENAALDLERSHATPADALLSELNVLSHMNASGELAARMIRKAGGRVALRPEPHRFAAFHVLRSAETAAILFEAGYLSNAEDEAMLRSPEARGTIVTALAEAIEADIATRVRR